MKLESLKISWNSTKKGHECKVRTNLKLNYFFERLSMFEILNTSNELLGRSVKSTM